ncbi:MAG: flagellar basal body P-ring formation chaperone FlgA [Alphaproteobacteria bacterium]
MTKTHHLLFAVWLIVAGSFATPQPCNANALVTLRAESEVRKMVVRLSDVFDGVPAGIDREIAQAPAPGKSVTYDVNVLTRLATKYRLDWQAQSTLDHVVIKTAATRITADTIRDAVIAKIKTNEEFVLPKHSEVDVSFDNRALEINLPADQKDEFTLNNFSFDPINKHFRADIVAQTGSGPFSVPLSGRLTIKRRVAVLSHRLPGGATISASDVDVMLVPEDRVNPATVTDASQLIGRELRRDTDEGEIMRTNDVIPQRLVVRGSIVTLKIETPMMLVTAQGKALQDGTMGDVVRVTNIQSNRTVEGTVTSTGTVTIMPQQKLAAAQ